VEFHASSLSTSTTAARSRIAEHRRALHEQQHVVFADLVADAIEHLGSLISIS